MVQSQRKNVADTSIECYHQIKNAGQLEREKELVLKLLVVHEPVTSRQLAYLSQKERTNITRTLFDLKAIGKAKVAYTAKCPTTNKRVGYYCTDTWKEAQPC